ncbi:MAG TPA: hypothetical protein VGQ62_22285 [Chloroflexota bacterium]|jgi:hypothetical protein|nr:hypothetical protein [Chloroflexota bacterium]
MMRFLFGVAIGAGGYWAYKQGLLPFSAQDVFEQVMPGGNAEIIRPTPHEVSSRPVEPIPSPT